ncbi:MAG: beta-galactosidase [Planctomycetota bacterium]|jgi:hypothetical protein
MTMFSSKPIYTLILILLLALATPCFSAEGPVAMDLIEQTPEKLTQTFADLRASYRGQDPDELLSFIEMVIGGEEDGLELEEDAGERLTGEAKANRLPFVEAAVDLLYEWPTPALTTAILKGLESGDETARQTALLAAPAAAEDARVAQALGTIISEPDTPIGHVVLALRALGENTEAGTRKVLKAHAADPRPAVREAARVSLRQAKVAGQKWTVPALGSAPGAPTFHIIGPKSLLSEYTGLPTAPLESAETDVLIMLGGPRLRRPFTPENCNAMTGVLKRGGTVILSLPNQLRWSDGARRWAQTNSVTLPGKTASIIPGPGIADSRDYRAFADTPYRLSDQPGSPAEVAWAKWPAAFSAPIRSSDGTNALMLISEGVQGKGRLILTTVPLAKRPLYAENLLRWIAGDNLLAYARTWTPTFAMSTDGFTPHTPWAKPGTGGKPKVLYLTLTTYKRGLLELSQRMDLEWKYVPYDGTFAYPPLNREDHVPSRMGQRAVALLEAGLPWADLLLFDAGVKNMIRSITSKEREGSASFDTIPGRIRRSIYRRVHRRKFGLLGCGSVRTTETSLQEFVARINKGKKITLSQITSPIVPLPFQAPTVIRRVKSQFAGATVGQGRMLWFDQVLPHHLLSGSHKSPDLLPSSAHIVPGLLKPRFAVKLNDYAYGKLVKAVQWTASSLPATRITATQVSKAAAGREGQLTFSLSKAFTGTADLTIRNAWNRTLVSSVAPVKGKAVTMKWPARPAGWYIAEVRIRDDASKVVDFTAVRIEIPGTVRITSAAAAKRFHRPGETAEVTVTLSQATHGSLRATAHDTWGRRVWQGPALDVAGKDSLTVPVAIQNPLSRLWDIRLVLHDGDRAISAFQLPIGIERPPLEKDLHIMQGSLSRDEEIPLFQKAVGIDIATYEVETCLRNNISLTSMASDGALAFAGALSPGERAVKSERSPCISSPSLRIKAVKALRERGPLLKGLGVMGYTIDDECVLAARCLSRYCLARFRRWLQQRYATLDALNREWGTAFKDWTSVVPLQGKDSARPASFADFRHFNAWKFAEYSSHLEMEAEDYVPGFRAGHSSCPVGGFMDELSGLIYYYGVNEATVGRARPDTIIGSWYAPGYRYVENHEASSRSWAWSHLFRGTTRVAIWHPYDGGCGYRSDFSRPTMANVWLGEEMRAIRLGVGKLMRNAERVNGPAAVLYSLRNLHNREAVTEIESLGGGTPNPRYPRSGTSLQPAILEAQVECRVMSRIQLLEGALEKRKNRLLILPGVSSLSTRERKVLKAFVQSGGTLVADLNVGLRNEHGTWTGHSFAKELFGVTFEEGFKTPKEDKSGLTLNSEATAHFPALAALKDLQISTQGLGAKLAGSQALATLSDGQPALIVNRVGKGHAIYLNFTAPRKAAYTQALGADLAAFAKASPLVRIVDKTGTRLPLDFGHFESGKALFSGFVMRGTGMIKREAPQAITLTFPVQGHLYDVRKGSYLGHQREHRTTLTPAIAQAYALLPVKVTGLSVQGQESIAPGKVLSVSAAATAEGGAISFLQVWTTELKAPGGKALPAHSRRVLVYHGKTELSFPIALNAVPGSYRLRLRDAATGTVGEHTFTVTTEN